MLIYSIPFWDQKLSTWGRLDTRNVLREGKRERQRERKFDSCFNRVKINPHLQDICLTPRCMHSRAPDFIVTFHDKNNVLPCKIIKSVTWCDKSESVATYGSNKPKITPHTPSIHSLLSHAPRNAKYPQQQLVCTYTDNVSLVNCVDYKQQWTFQTHLIYNKSDVEDCVAQHAFWLPFRVALIYTQ